MFHYNNRYLIDMKKILLSSALAALVLIGPGCKKDYLETGPTDRVETAAIFSTTDNANIALNGIYRFMFERTTEVTTNQQGRPGVAGVLLSFDFMGEDMLQNDLTWFTNGAGNYVDARTDNASGNTYFYRTFFRMIGNANYIIDNIDAAQGTAADRSRIKAEALTLRAYAYSYLVQLYGTRYVAGAANNQLAVPMPLKSTDTKMPRVSVETVYKQIIVDLDAAIALNALPSNKTHASVWVARGLRARVALTMQDYTTAITFAKQVIDGNAFPLMNQADYQSGFNNIALSEFMWASNANVEQGDTFGSVFAQIAYNANTTYVRGNPKLINSALYAKIPATDVRKKLWEPAPTAANFPLPATTFTRRPYMNKKFSVKAVGDPSLGDYPWMRSAEMYLILAEAYARSGQTGLAQTALFSLVSKRDLSATQTTATADVLIDEILFNRRIELWGEGYRYLDLKRLNLPLDRNVVPNFVATSVGNVMQIPAGDSKFLYLIPRDEINANPNIGPQNP